MSKLSINVGTFQQITCHFLETIQSFVTDHARELTELRTVDYVKTSLTTKLVVIRALREQVSFQSIN